MILLLAYWRWILGGVLLAVAAGGAAHKMHQHDQIKFDALQTEYATFKARVQAAGEVAQKQAQMTELANKQAKERADSENSKSKRDLGALYAAYGKLRDARISSGSSFLPSPSPGAASPPVASFDRTALDRALSVFDRGITGLIGEGDQAIVDLDTARRWAHDRQLLQQ